MRFLPESPGTSRAVKAAVLAAVLILAAVLRLLPIEKGLPYLHDWDEPQIASTALHMMKTGDLDPHFFHYGSLTLYAQLGVDVVHYLYLLGREPIPFPVVPGIYSHDEIDLGAIETWHDTGFLWEVSHPSFYLWNRGFNALLGTATVLVTFLLGRALSGAWVGLVAAALLAVQGFHVERSATVNPDVAMTLCALVAVWCSVVFVGRPRPRWLVLALVFCGLSASAKYNGIYCGLAPAAALVVVAFRQRVSPWLWGALPAVPILVFFVTTPFALLDLPAFLSQAGFELYHYAARGHGAVPVEPGWRHFTIELRRVTENFGVVAGLIAVVGAGSLLRRPAGFVTLVYPVFYFLYMSTTRAAFHRNLLIAYPVLAVAAAAGVAYLATRLSATRIPKPFGRIAVVLTLGWLLGSTLSKTLSEGRDWDQKETRSQAIDAISEMGGARQGFLVGLSEEVRFHRVDLERLGVPYEVRPHLDLVCDAGRYDVIAAGARYAGLWSSRPDAKRKALLLNQAVLEGVERREIGGPLDGFNVTRLDAASQDPVVVLYSTGRRVERLPEVCTAEEIR